MLHGNKYNFNVHIPKDYKLLFAENFVLPSNVPTNCVFPWYDEVGQTEHLGCAVAAYDDAWCSINTVYKSTDHDKEGVEWEWCRPQSTLMLSIYIYMGGGRLGTVGMSTASSNTVCDVFV